MGNLRGLRRLSVYCLVLLQTAFTTDLPDPTLKIIIPYYSKTPAMSTTRLLCGFAALLVAIFLYQNYSVLKTRFEINEEDDFAAAALEAVQSKSTQLFFDKLFKKVMKTANGQNTILASLSANIVMAMATYGADGKTFDQMKEALQLPEDEKFALAGFKELLEELNKVTRLKVANKIYVAKGLELKSEFKELASESFKSEIGEIDVSQPEKAAKDVNSGVKEKTRNKIDKNDIDKDTAMHLLNDVSFKRTWGVRFDVKDTKDRIFNLISGRQKNVPTMYVKGNFDHGAISDLDARYIRLPNANLDLEMLIVVPNQIEGIHRVIDNLEILRSSDSFNRNYKQVELYLPKFKFNSSIDLKQPLQELGMIDMFGNAANFGRISRIQLQLHRVTQEAIIEVNEDGSEVAVITKVFSWFLSNWHEENNEVFKVDRPFWFQIRNKKTKTTLCTGTIFKP